MLWKRKNQKLKDPFALFKQAVDEIFEPLFTEFGFRHVETLEYMPECLIKYHNETTGLHLTYEWKSRMWVSLVKLQRLGKEVTEVAKFDFLFVLQIRQPEIDNNDFHGGDKEWTTTFVEERLRDYATLLRKSARDVLTGDFSIFPELKKLSAANRRKWNKEMFGTSSGESARFTTRPTLEQIFAGAKDRDLKLDRFFGRKLNQDRTDVCIYDSYWDHEYSIREIADFLNETEESIQHALDEYDNRG